MKFVLSFTLSRMRRQKRRLLFVLLAIAASSCLVVWTIGGFNALFMDETTQEANFLGKYDLRIASAEFSPGGAAARGGQIDSPMNKSTYDLDKKEPAGKKAPVDPAAAPNTDEAHGAEDTGREFVSPTSRDAYGAPLSYESTDSAAESSNASDAAETSEKGAEKDSDKGAEKAKKAAKGKERRGGKGGGLLAALKELSAAAISPETIAAIRQDEKVALCDEISVLRMYVYSPGTDSSILDDPDAVDENGRPTVKRSLAAAETVADAPKGVDPELHRRAFAAYRSTMGTALGRGTFFQSTTASEAPFELEDGRWFRGKDASGLPAREAVLTTDGAKQFKAKVGDKLILLGVASLIGKTVEYQVDVVGIVDDPEQSGFYISHDFGAEIAASSGVPAATVALAVKLRGCTVEEFRSAWNEKFASANLASTTREEIVQARLEAFKQDQSFKYQAASGALLASLAALLIVFTALNTSVDELRRLIAFYRVSGLTRSQVALSILAEGLILAIPGWIAGMIAGWALVYIVSEKPTGLNWDTVGFSFLCTVVGAIVAALYPMFQSARVKPLEALGIRTGTIPYAKARRRQTAILILLAIVGGGLILGDATLIRYSTIDTMKRAAIHSGIGVLSLAVGVVCLLPLAIRLAELVVGPVMAFILRFDSRLIRRELSGNAGRVAAVAIALSVGGGLFTTMQIWGYSMLEPFLPGKGTPDAFAAFLPNGLRPEGVEELKNLPCVDPERFMPVAVEQAAFAEDSIPDVASKSKFANVVFFGVDPSRAFSKKDPLVGLRFRQGTRDAAREAMQSGRGVVVTDSLSVDFKLNLGDTLKVTHPREPGKILEYPIVGVVAFEGWQWLSKTSGVRRNFGRSGGIVFAREGIVADDFELSRRSYFWFDGPGGSAVDYSKTEALCDRLARKTLSLDLAEEGKSVPETASQTAYVKLSTRKSLTDSIMGRADKVIWGLSKTPLTTLVIASIAVIGAVANSVRSRRWQFGVMRALGLTRWAIARMILVEAVLIGTVASATSFFFGFLAAQGALKLGRSMFGTFDPPLILPFGGLMLGLALTLTLCVAAALYPALRTGYAEPLRLLQSGRTPD